MPFFKKEKSWKTIRNEILEKSVIPPDLKLFLFYTLTDSLTDREKDRISPEAAIMALYLTFDTFCNEKILALLPTEAAREEYIAIIINPHLQQTEYIRFVHRYIPNFENLREGWVEEFRNGAYNNYVYRHGEIINVANNSRNR